MSNEKQTNKDSVCLKCYKLKCNARSIENKACPNNEGPVDWKGRKINGNEREKAD